MSLSSLISFFVILFHVNASLAYTERCKSVSGTLDWPSEAEWNLLNRTISGALLNPQPPAQSCYITPPTSFSEAKCNLTTESWSDSSFIADDPVSVAYPNWQDDACIPPSLAIGKGNCSISLFPKYVVNATTSLHVAATLKYAVEKEIRVVVKGGAHDLLGRSTAPSALSIWTRNLRGMQFHEQYFSCDNNSFPYAAITAAAGNNMGEIYAEAARYNMTIVGGADPNVGLGGYLTGGGHSPLSSRYGLAVDNIVEMFVATPTGDIIRANVCENQEFFWAIRGGGGATFGVLLNATIRAYPMPSVTFTRLDFNSTKEEATDKNNTAFYNAASRLISDLPDLYTKGISGYFSMVPITEPVEGKSQMNFAFLLYSFESNPTLQEKLSPIMSQLNITPGLTTSLPDQQTLRFIDFQAIYMRSDSVGMNRFTVSRLWDAPAVSDTENVNRALRSFSNSFLQGTAVTGSGVQRKPLEDSAVHPAWRRTVVHMMGNVGYALGGSEDERSAAMQLADTLSEDLYAVAPDMGCYVNEAHIHQPDYRKAFWGENYDKLLGIKRRVDPAGVFWCEMCVGADDWILQADGRICKMDKGVS